MLVNLCLVLAVLLLLGPQVTLALTLLAGIALVLCAPVFFTRRW